MKYELFFITGILFQFPKHFSARQARLTLNNKKRILKYKKKRILE